MKEESFSKYSLIFLLVIWLAGCAHLGIADKATMMERWNGQIAKKGVAIQTLFEINEYGNWLKMGEPSFPTVVGDEEGLKNWKQAPGNCADQTGAKLAILKELNIPAKRMHCAINRDAFLPPTGHAFCIAQAKDGKWYLMDNGAIDNCVWEYREMIAHSYGIEQVEEW
ncbi:MAG TPA: hypothetical protein DCY12_08820 [Candidatus Atribacteria bacterium]|nr:hypothetical protein [Candidatus Atribacteria bacterium]